MAEEENKKDLGACVSAVNSTDMLVAMNASILLYRKAVQEDLIVATPKGDGEFEISLSTPFSRSAKIVEEFMDAAFDPPSSLELGRDEFCQVVTKALCKASSFVFLAKGFGMENKFPDKIAREGAEAERTLDKLGVKGPCSILFLETRDK